MFIVTPRCIDRAVLLNPCYRQSAKNRSEASKGVKMNSREPLEHLASNECLIIEMEKVAGHWIKECIGDQRTVLYIKNGSI